MTAPSTTPKGRSTIELCAVSDLGDDALGLNAASVQDPRAFITSLCERGLHSDAVRFLAHALPGRECVWWAWVCARKSAGDTPPPAIKAALEATERWIVQPTEEHRRQALHFGEAADFGTPAGCAALAAFMTSGSLAPPDAPPVPPGEFMTAKAVAGSVTLSAVLVDPAHAADKFNEFVKIGLEVADRTKLWPS